MTSLPAMQVFHDVPVVPVLSMHRSKGIGGPVWPDFDTQVAARFCRDGVPADRRPRPAGKLRLIDRPAVWGGFLMRQFGHLVAENLTRLPQSLRDRPNDLYMFTVVPGVTRETLPAYVWDVLRWYGVRLGKVRLVTRPFLTKELHVAAQGEMLGGVPTSPEYLDLLEARALRNGLQPVSSPLTFVTRAGMVAKGMGGHAGESYLAELLTRLGVLVIDPGHVSIVDQLAHYAGARQLVFSEGSAIHGRCMLGRVAQDIHILRRRASRNTGRTQLTPRCTRLAYHQALCSVLGCETETRRNRLDLQASIYDLDVLFAVFLKCGVDLHPHWDSDAYRAAVHADVAGWFTANRCIPAQARANLATLARLGFATDALPDQAAPSDPKG